MDDKEMRIIWNSLKLSLKENLKIDDTIIFKVTSMKKHSYPIIKGKSYIKKKKHWLEQYTFRSKRDLEKISSEQISCIQ